MRSREIEELVEALERHLRLLEEYSVKAFREGNADFGGELAGKLRLLVIKFGSNRPLLLDLMAETGIEPLLTLGGPPIKRPAGEPGAGDKISLGKYLQLDAVGVKIPNGDFILLKKAQFIRAWAEQSGASHEDWSLDPALETILKSQIYLGGIHGAFRELKVTTDAVLHIAKKFLEEYHARRKTQEG